MVVIVHGASEHSDRYRHVAAALLQDGYAVYALDHRGHGRSQGPRAVIDRLDYAVADVDQLVLRARAEHPGLPVFMLGHSMGGTVAVRYAVLHQDRLRRPDPVRAAGRARGRAGAAAAGRTRAVGDRPHVCR